MGKKGPPYEKDPGVTFIVIEQPWGVGRKERMTHQGADNIGAWIRYMLRQPERDDILVENVYSRTTEDIVIVQLPGKVDVTQRLGAHKWIEFLKCGNKEDRDRISNIFVYNYRMNGDPEKHNWTPWIPTSQKPPPDKFPVKYPYPMPTWIEKTYALSSLALPIPRPPTPPPPALEPVPDVPKIKEDLAVKTEAAEAPLFVEKRDPYEEEDAAQQLIQSYPVKKEEPMDDGLPNIKREDVGASTDGYQPSAELVASMAMLSPRRFAGGQRPEPVVKAEPEDIKPLSHYQSDYTPRPALASAIQQYQAQSQHRAARPVKTEDTDILPRQPSSTSSHDPRSRTSVKQNKRPKYEDEDDLPLKKVKAERNRYM